MLTDGTLGTRIKMIEGIFLFLAISIAIKLKFWYPIQKRRFFIQNREPLTGEMWCKFSSVGEVYAAQQVNCGAFIIGGSVATKGELTVRQETFCRKFLEIGEATEAYRQSGYKHENYSDKSLRERASHLLADAKVAERVRESKAEAAKAQEITLEEVSTVLRTALEQALDRGQSGAAVAAPMGLGKLGGLVTDWQQIEAVDEGQAHLEALRELANKKAEKNAGATKLEVING